MAQWDFFARVYTRQELRQIRQHLLPPPAACSDFTCYESSQNHQCPLLFKVKQKVQNSVVMFIKSCLHVCSSMLFVIVQNYVSYNELC